MGTAAGIACVTIVDMLVLNRDSVDEANHTDMVFVFACVVDRWLIISMESDKQATYFCEQLSPRVIPHCHSHEHDSHLPSGRAAP
jgi:hypothetical protein